MKRLIVNADDYGMTGGINRSVEELVSAGVLTSATLMAASPYAPDGAAFAAQHPHFGVGCHIVLVDGAAVAGPSSLTPRGDTKLFPTLSAFLRAVWSRRITEADIEREATAQIARLQSMGVALDHVDTHKHTHMFPPVLRPVLRAAKARGLRAIRNPFEPRWSALRTRHGSFIRGMQVGGLRARYYGPFLEAVRDAELVTTDGSIGVLATGVLQEKILSRLLSRLPDGVWELVCHPGYADDELQRAGARLRASRETEHQALLSAVRPHANLLTNFSHLLKSA